MRTGRRWLGSLARRRPIPAQSWVQVGAIMMIALSVLVATWQFRTANGLWQDAVREEVRRSAAVQETIRHVYADEAVLAFRVAVAGARADGLRELAQTNQLAAAEYTMAAQTVHAFEQASPPDSLIGGDRYARGELGYDLVTRLADLRARHPELRDLDPDATHARAHQHAANGALAAGTGIAAVIIAVLAASIRPRPHPRARAAAPATSATSATSAAVDLVPAPEPGPPARGLRYLATLQLAAWALLAILPLTQLLVAGQQQQAQASAARQAVQLTTTIAAGGQHTAFRTASTQAAILVDLGAEARELAALDAPDPASAAEQQDLAAAERAIAARIQRIADAMGRAPAGTDRLDPATLAALTAQPQDWTVLLDHQHHQVDLAHRASNHALGIAASTAAAAIGATLLATARHRSRLRWGLAFLAFSLVTALVGALWG